MPLVATRGAASAQGFGEFAQSAAPNYIEDVFSTWLYTGNGSTQTITNGIDLSTKGGLVWLKARNQGTTGYPHTLYDTLRGIDYALFSNRTDAQDYRPGDLTSFNSSGFSLGNGYFSNTNNVTYASWTFRKQPKFFDVVTYTGTGSVQNIAHNLGSVPGCIIVKSMTDAVNWNVYHRSVGSGSRLILNTTDAALSAATTWNNTDPTSTQFTVGTSSQINFSGSQYVAYLFAHNAGGFGLTGTDNVITCGSYTGTGAAGNTITLGYEPQWVLIKRTDAASSWNLADTMRGMPADGFNNRVLYPNLSSAENGLTGIGPTATGFTITSTDSDYNGGGMSYIYIAIRRGPMKTPTTGTSVFLPTTYASPGLNVQSTVTTNFPIDLNICGARGANSGYTYKFWFTDRLRVSSGTSTSNSLLTAGNGTASETTYNGLATFFFDRMTSYQITDSNGSFNGRTAGSLTFGYDLRRAPGYFDVVCYTGNASFSRTVNHNLGVTPELTIVKCRSASGENWVVTTPSLGESSAGLPKNLYLESTMAAAGGEFFNASGFTSTTIGLRGWSQVNGSGKTYVAYLFASCPGVSKVGSFTGNGSSQTINCGFTGGARFVLIKRTDSSGQWYVWDSARGIVAGNDPYLSFSNDQSEDFNGASDSVDADSTGFIVNQNATNDVNINGASYIFLAIA